MLRPERRLLITTLVLFLAFVGFYYFAFVQTVAVGQVGPKKDLDAATLETLQSTKRGVDGKYYQITKDKRALVENAEVTLPETIPDNFYVDVFNGPDGYGYQVIEERIVNVGIDSPTTSKRERVPTLERKITTYGDVTEVIDWYFVDYVR